MARGQRKCNEPTAYHKGDWCGLTSLMSCFLQVSEAILDNARLMLQTENIQANAEDFKDRSEVTHTNTQWLKVAERTFLLQI